MNNIFQGDPALKITVDGATLVFRGGQPVLDQGLDNIAHISLFTAPDWPGNFLLTDAQQIGSDFEETARGPITLSRLALVEKSAESAMSAPIFGTVTAEASNPNSGRTDVLINVQPPGATRQTVLLTSNGQNWINQAENPAHERL
jgi:hypothetical protein